MEEHDEHLLEQINRRVKPGDTLWHLGDFGFGFGKREGFAALRARINCKTVNLILGNHDHAFTPKAKGADELRQLFRRVRDVWSGRICGRFFHLSHYAHRAWAWQHQGSCHLFGHSHGNLADDPHALSLDVGVDTTWYGHERYAPYHVDEVFHIMDKHKQFKPVDHHRAAPEGGSNDAG